MIEVLIVISIIALLIVTAVTFVRPSINRGRDSRRKADLHKIANALEEYRTDKRTYPNQAEMSLCGANNVVLEPYIKSTPCEVSKTTPYYYLPEDTGCLGTEANPCVRYRLMTQLWYKQDPDIERIGCTNDYGALGIGCYRDGITDEVYDYGVAAGRPMN